MTPEEITAKQLQQERQALERGRQAKEILEHPIVQQAFADVERLLERKALECEADDKDMAWRVVLSKKIFAQIKDTLGSYIIQGENAREVTIPALEKSLSFWDRMKRPRTMVR